MLKYDILGIIHYDNIKVGLRVVGVDDRIEVDLSYNELKEKIIKKAISVTGVTVVGGKLRIQDSDKLELFNIGVPNNVFLKGQELLGGMEYVINYEHREMFDDILDWTREESGPEILALYGLRRTGKTVLLLQVCDHYIKEGYKVAYTDLSKQADIPQFLSQLHNLVINDYKLIVIDEITSVEGFLYWGNRLSDMYAPMGVKIIISGTQSLMLEMARLDILFDRVHMINTTYISYKEYNRLFKGATVGDYIKYGGVLYKSRVVTEGSFNNYINTAIVQNIKHTIELSNLAKRTWPDIFIDLKVDRLFGAIQLFIMACTESLFMDDIDYGFIDRNLRSALNLLNDKSIKKADVLMLGECTQYFLGIHTGIEINSDIFEGIRSLLVKLDMLTYGREIYTKGKGELKERELPIFIQPGVQYDQAMETIQTLLASESNLGSISNRAENISEKMMQDIEGKLLESTIRLNLIQLNKESKSANIFSLNTEGKEIDIVVQKKTGGVILIEVKRSSIIDRKQYKWLCDPEFNTFIEDKFGKIEKRIIVYTGETKLHRADKHNILYINARDWLLTTEKAQELMQM